MSAPDDLPSLSRIRKPEESSSSSNDSMSQPSTTPPAEPRPSTSNGHESGHTRSGHSHPELHSSGQLGNHHSRRPSTGRSSTDSRSSTSGGRSSHGDNTVRRLSSMRDRVLISNANAMARGMSLNELDDTTTTTSSSSPSPHMNGNGHSNTDDDQQPAAGMSNGSRKKKKKKNKQWHRSSDDSDLMGFTGLYPNLSRATNQVLDGNPGLESQTSDELRALSRRGLMVYPREAQGSEAAAAPAPHPQPPPPLQSLGTTSSPSPMSSPIESSSLSPNSELNRNLTPGPETGLVVPELEQQHEPPTTTTTTSTNLTTTTTTASNSPTAAAAATPRAKSVADAEADADAKELQSQSEAKTKTKEEQKEEVVAGGPSTSSVASGKRQGSPLDKPAKERKKRRHDKLKESKYDLSPPQSSRRHKHGEPSSSVRSRSRSKSLSSKDLLPKLEKAKSRSKSQESLAKDLLDLSSETVATKEEQPPEPSPPQEPDINVKSDSPKSTKSETPSSDAVKKPETPSPNAVNSETPNAVKPVAVEVPPLDPPMVDKTESPESSVAKPEAPSTSVAKPEAPSTSVAEPAAASSSEVKPMLPPNNDATSSSTTKRKSKAKRSPKGGHKLNQSKPHEVEPQEPAVMGKRVPKPKVPKGASPPSEGWTSTSAVKGKVHRPSSTNGGNPAAGASVSRKPRKMSEMSTGKDSSVWPEKKEMSEEDAARLALAQMKPEPQPQPEPQPSTPMDVGELSDGSEEDDNDDAGSSSSSSAMEIAEEVEFPPGQLPPAPVFDEQEQQAQPQAQAQEQGQNNDPYRELKDMDVVVIGGRKAVFVRGPPERPPMKLVPRPPDLTSYDRIYRKRIQDKRMGQTLAMSVNDAHVGVNVMAAVMRTMNMKERVTMSQVCTSWAMVSRDNRVWNTVILRDTVVKSWHRLLMEMARHRTQELDMRGVTLDPVQRLSSDLRILRPLRILCTDATTNDFLKVVQSCLPRLHELRMTCVSAHLNLTRMEKMRKLRVLRINMTHPKAQIIRLRGLVNLDLLTELIIRGVTNLKESLDLRALKTLRNLRILKLGSCEDLNNQMLGLVVLPCLEELRTLRIENDHKAMTTVFPVDDILEGVSAAGEVERLELINVDVDSSFGQLLAKCNTVASLLLAPKCLHNTATMINAVMQAVKDNSDHLITFRLVLVTQLLSATENLYKGTQKNVIPVQRPVPGIPPDDALNHCAPEDNCQEEEHTQCVAFLPVERLEQILNEMMRMGCVSVAKVAMSETTNVQFLERDVSAST